jgi:hypothetical protein
MPNSAKKKSLQEEKKPAMPKSRRIMRGSTHQGRQQRKNGGKNKISRQNKEKKTQKIRHKKGKPESEEKTREKPKAEKSQQSAKTYVNAKDVKNQTSTEAKPDGRSGQEKKNQTRRRTQARAWTLEKTEIGRVKACYPKKWREKKKNPAKTRKLKAQK